jgi:hypothetical protein
MGPVSDPLAVRFGPAALSASVSSASQTVSPNGKVLSVLFNGVSVEVEAADTRAAAMAGSLMVPLESVTTPVFVKMDIRGEAAVVGAGATSRLGIEVNGFFLGNNSSTPGGPIQQDVTLELRPDAPFVVINCVLSGQVFGADPVASALVTLDSIDLSFE